MKQLKFLMLVFLLPLFMTNVNAAEWQSRAELKKIFSKAKTVGAFVAYDVSNSVFMGFDGKRVNIPYVPASTFKIPNSLIALATGTVKNVDEILPYGGGDHDMKEWNRDMSLRDAIKVSNVPVYQGVARRVGMDNMQTYIDMFHYGNRQLGDRVDLFWLAGPLKISAVQQAVFLADLAQGKLPIDEKIQAQVRDILLLESGEGWKLYGKTGWYTNKETGKGLGWWVGWIEKEGHTYSFALNMDGEFNSIDLAKRINLGKASLCALELYPCEKITN